MKKTIWKVLSFIFISVMFVTACEKPVPPEPPTDPENPGVVDPQEEDQIDPNNPIASQLGLSSDPEIINADQLCTIHFRPKSDSDLFDTTDDLYMHIGLYRDEDWEFVQADWNENIDKCKLQKIEENHWVLEVGPTVREYFQSGQTPLVKLAMVVRNSDGSAQTKPDCFMPVQDDLYQYKPFEPLPVVNEPLPADCDYGINYNVDGSVTLVLNEKAKDGSHYDYCYLIGEATEWKRDHTYAMKRDDQKGCWWYTISADKIDPDKEYMFQYHVGMADNSKHFRVTDPYTEIVYDGWNDKYISSTTYPNLPEFPKDTKQLVSAFKVNRDAYNWEVPQFHVKDGNDLIIYELLLRDFTKTQDLNGAMTKLDYLKDLGITAIELMPVQEFDGNESWGYDVTHYFALDKAYGTRQTYKKFIDECHKRGIAVIFDVVYNHVTGNGPMAKLYYEGSKTTYNNPWFNVDAPHQFSVFHDWNHENLEVREYIKSSLRYLLNEYHIDGFRFDLTKGFTQNSGMEGSYDQSRVDILKDYNNAIKEVKSDAIVILEHFVDPENVELGNNGMKVWRNLNGEFKEIGRGGNADLGRLREGYEPFGTFVSFMESHDEERMLLPWSGENVSASVRKAPKTKSDVSWGICGTMTGWGTEPDIALVPDGKYLVATDVAFTAEDMFKVRGNNEWKLPYNLGAWTENFKLMKEVEYEMKENGSNFMVEVPGTYDVCFDYKDNKKIWLMEPGKRPDNGGENPNPGPNPGPNPDPIKPGNTPQFSETGIGPRMKRGALAATFFLTVPGPKMIWQFSELGYDQTIMYGGNRTAKKPILWEYFEDPNRRALYDTYAGILKFRAENDRFFDMDAKIETNLGGACKTIYGSVDGKNFMLIGNFDRNQMNVELNFKASGNWRNWFNENEKYTGNKASTTLSGSEFRLYVNF